jgi:hypothetical protein
MRYLFVCGFEDGSIIEQNAEDVSPVNSSKSCFWDVLQKEATGVKPIAFCLEGQDGEDKGKLYYVDLLDGHFEINGVQFWLHEEHVSDLKLIYFRRNTQMITNGVVNSHQVDFVIGWQVRGQDTQRTITIR